MTCKDCLCYRACNFHIDEETGMTVNECATGFLPRDQYVKLPVYIGQPVWYVRHWVFSNEVEIKEGKVSMLQQKADKSWKFRVSEGGYVADYTLNDIDMTIFLSLEAAEKEYNRIVMELNV